MFYSCLGSTTNVKNGGTSAHNCSNEVDKRPTRKPWEHDNVRLDIAVEQPASRGAPALSEGTHNAQRRLCPLARPFHCQHEVSYTHTGQIRLSPDRRGQIHARDTEHSQVCGRIATKRQCGQERTWKNS